MYQCVLLDPEDATPLRDIPLNKVPLVPFDEPLLGILDRFQEGHSHMAIVTRVSRTAESRDDQGSINMETKVGLTKRFLNKVGLSDHIEEHEHEDVELGMKKGMNVDDEKNEKEVEPASAIAPAKRSLLLGVPNTPLEQTMPSDAVLSKEGAQKVCYLALSFLRWQALISRYRLVLCRHGAALRHYHTRRCN